MMTTFPMMTTRHTLMIPTTEMVKMILALEVLSAQEIEILLNNKIIAITTRTKDKENNTKPSKEEDLQKAA